MSYKKRVALKIKPLVAIIATSFIGAQLGLATPVLIDTFSSTQVNPALSTAGTGTKTSANPGNGEVIGGFRILDSYYQSGGPGLLEFQTQGTPDNFLALNSGLSVKGAGLASYCGNATCGPSMGTFDGSVASSTPTGFGLGGVSLVNGTNTQIRVIGSSDHNVTITARFYTNALDFAESTFILPGDEINHTFVLTFNNINSDAPFTFNGGATASIFSGGVNAITFEIQGVSSSDTRITYFAADDVPEPSTFGMLTGGLGGLLWFARKRLKA